MNPAWSVVIFTTIAGAAQGLVVTLALAVLTGIALPVGFMSGSLIVAEVMLVIGLGASFAHLGRPERAWRAAMMWRTSWLSREVIVLPIFIAAVAVWWVMLRYGVGVGDGNNGVDVGTGPGARVGVNSPWSVVVPISLIAIAAVLWYCTAMIYACLRFIEEWAQPLTLVNFTLIGLSSGAVLASALAALAGERALLAVTGPAALALTLIAWVTRMLALRHNALIRHKSTLQTATGIQAPKLVQKSMGMSAGSFNTREFFHGRSGVVLRQVRLALIVLGFAVPAALSLWGTAWSGDSGVVWPWALAVASQIPGLLADRWFFFAQAKHPQNLYYQTVS